MDAQNRKHEGTKNTLRLAQERRKKDHEVYPTALRVSILGASPFHYRLFAGDFHRPAHEQIDQTIMLLQKDAEAWDVSVGSGSSMAIFPVK